MASPASTPNCDDRVKAINDWKESWMKEIDSIVRQAIQEPDQNITETDLNDRLQETLNYFYGDNIDSEATVCERDSRADFHFRIEVMPHINDKQQSDASDISSIISQALIIKQHPSAVAKCFKDPAGVMAITDDQLAYVDLVWNHENVREMKMHLISNIRSRDEGVRKDRIIDFPYVGERVRVVDMDYWPTHDRYVLAVVQTGEERASWHYLFNPQATDDEEFFERWVSCQPGDTVSRVCCTAQTVYEIVNYYRSGFVLLLNVHGVTRTRKSASDLFPPNPDFYDSDNLRLIDICCPPSNKQLAVAYNCSVGSQWGQVGIHIFDLTNSWTLLGRIDLGHTDVQFYMPRLMYLDKVALFIALHVKNGNLLFYNSHGERVGKRPFIGYAEEYEEDQPHVYPINICASQNWVAVRFSRWITVHRIND